MIVAYDLQQLAGLIAHEVGHFSQPIAGSAMALIAWIDEWFERAVYTRDDWDDWLLQCCEEAPGRVRIIFYLARGVVWLSRRLLWVLLQMEKLISFVMQRQREFDADRYEARMAGSDRFTESLLTNSILGVSYHGTLDSLSSWWDERRLPDSLPQVVSAHVERMSVEERSDLGC